MFSVTNIETQVFNGSLADGLTPTAAAALSDAGGARFEHSAATSLPVRPVVGQEHLPQAAAASLSALTHEHLAHDPHAPKTIGQNTMAPSSISHMGQR